MFTLIFKFSDALMTVPFYGDNGLMYKIYNHGFAFWKKYLHGDKIEDNATGFIPNTDVADYLQSERATVRVQP